jgi:hypothetical protein
MADLEAAVRRQIKATDEQIERFVSRLDKFLSDELTTILSKVDVGKGKGREAIKALGGLQDALEQAGLGARLQDIESVYGVQLKAVSDHFEKVLGQKDVLNAVDFDTAEQLITLDESVLRNKIFSNTSELASTVFRQVISGDVPDVHELVKTFTNRTAAQITTELNTATAGFSRALNQKKAKDVGFELFVYLGPLDKITRPFCRKRVGKVFTSKEIAAWDNEQGLPANIYCGGYNCRHELRPVSEEYARELGYQIRTEKGAV